MQVFGVSVSGASMNELQGVRKCLVIYSSFREDPKFQEKLPTVLRSFSAQLKSSAFFVKLTDVSAKREELAGNNYNRASLGHSIAVVSLRGYHDSVEYQVGVPKAFDE